MKIRGRSFLKASAILVAAVVLIGLLIHSTFAKDSARKFLVTSLDDRLGGSSSIERLDYRLWRGEIRLLGITWSSSDEALSVRVDEVVVHFDPWDTTSVALHSPEVRIRSEESEGDGQIQLPGWLLNLSVTVTDGRLAIGEVEIEDLATTLDPRGGLWEGSVSTGRARAIEGWPFADFDAVGARVRVSTTSADIVEFRVAKDASYVEGPIRIESFSPFVMEADLTHAIEGPFVREILPDVIVDGPVVGKASVRREDDTWRAGGTLEASGVTYPPMESVGLRAPWRLDGDIFRVDNAELSGYGGTTRVSAIFDSASDTQELEVTVDGIEADARLASRVVGTASVSLQQWNVESMRGFADLELRRARTGPGVPLRGRVRVELDGLELAVRAPRLEGPGFSLEAGGRVGERLALQYTAHVEDVAALPIVPSSLGLTGSARVEGRVEGPLSEPGVTAEISTNGFAISGVPLDAEATLSWAGRYVELVSLSARHASGGALSLRGSFDLETEALSLRGEGDDFTLREIPELEASISSIGVEVEGSLGALRGQASAEFRNVRYRGVVLPAASVVVEADGTGAQITGSADGETMISGRVNGSAPYGAEARVRLDRLPLGELLRTVPDYGDTELALEGALFATGELSDLQSFRYRLEAEQVVGSYRGVGFGVSSPFVLEGDLAGLSIRDLTLVGADTAIGIDGELPLASSGALDLHARGVARLELLSLWLPEAGLAGRADLEIRASGALPQPELHGDVQLSDAAANVGGLHVDGVRARALLQGETVLVEELTGEFLGGRLRVDGELPFHEGRGAEVRLRFRLDDIVPSMLLETEADGSELRVSAAGELAGTTSDVTSWRGSGEIEEVRASLRALALASAGAAAWSLEDGLVRFAELRVSGVDTDITLSGEAMPFVEPLEWTAEASGGIDPRFLSPTLSELGMALTGRTEFRVRASQGSEPLALEGEVSIREGRLSVREPALAFTNLTGDLELRGESMKLTRLDANVGGGTVRGEGEIAIEGTSISSVDLLARARSVRLGYPEGLRSEIDGTVRLSGPPSELALTGDITLARAIFSRNINIQTELLESLSRVSMPATSDSFANRIDLDVNIRTREGLRVDNNLARMDASANLRLLGTIAEPEMAGTVSAREGGEFRFGRNTYRIESGRIALQGYPVEPPELDITARTSVTTSDDTYDIRLAVRGPADDLTTELTGTSQKRGRETLSRADVASLLLTGRTVDKVSSEGRTILGEQMASYLGASLADLAHLGLGGALPFNIVTAEPALIAGEADPSARFTLGAGLTESLSVVYSVGLDDAEKQIWIVDYKLPRRTRTQLIRQDDTEFTFAFGQQLQIDVNTPARDVSDPRNVAMRVGFYFVTGEPGDLETEARERLKIEPGQRYDYWKAWERVEGLLEWLRDQDFLEATADLNETPCGQGCVELDVFVATGKRVRFRWSGDELDNSVRDALVAAWDGYMTPAFLAADLESIAVGRLFERRYYLAQIAVDVEEAQNEITVSVVTSKGPRGARVEVDFSGNEGLPDETLLTALPKQTTSEFHQLITFRQPRFRQILEVRYASLGYLQAEIGEPVTSFDAASGVLRVTIPVEEHEPSVVDRVELDGVERLAETTVRSRVALREGEPFRLTQFVQDRSGLAAFYRRQGFPDVEVDSAIVPGSAPGSLVARYIVREGPEVTVGDIRVTGNVHTRESVIRREVALKPGQPLRMSDVSKTQKGLYELGIFRSAEVVVSEPETESASSVRDVLLEVAEAPDVTLDYGVRYTTDGVFQVQADVGAPNLFGRAQRVGLRTLLGGDERIFRFTYRAPYLARYKLSTDFFVERAVETQVSDDATDPITDRTWTFTGQQRRALQEKLGLQWSYSFRRIVTAFEDPNFGPQSFSTNRSIFTAALIGDYRDNVVSPLRGNLWSVSMQYAPEVLGASSKFVKIFAQAFTFVPLGRGVVWAAGYRMGAANDFGERLLEDDRFQAGGPSSVRGFAQGTLGPVDPILEMPIGGAGLLMFNQEIRFPIAWRLRGVGFYDAGNAFAQPSDISLSGLRHSAGAGLRLELPFGLLRFDWARVLDPQDGDDLSRFIFSLGHAF